MSNCQLGQIINEKNCAHEFHMIASVATKTNSRDESTAVLKRMTQHYLLDRVMHCLADEHEGVCNDGIAGRLCLPSTTANNINIILAYSLLTQSSNLKVSIVLMQW